MEPVEPAFTPGQSRYLVQQWAHTGERGMWVNEDWYLTFEHAEDAALELVRVRRTRNSRVQLLAPRGGAVATLVVWRAGVDVVGP